MSKQTILIVEDNRDLRFVLAALLNHDGFRVVEATDGEESVGLACSERPHLILMDIRLPGIDGFEASEIIHSQNGLEDVPIVAVTAESLDGAQREQADRLFQACLSKPVGHQVLLEHVHSIVDAPASS